jgi:transposase
LIQIAHAAGQMKQTYLAAKLPAEAARRGKKRALVALGHTVLVFSSHILTGRQPYHELGAAYFDYLERQTVEQRLVRRPEQLGYHVSLQPLAPNPDLAA